MCFLLVLQKNSNNQNKMIQKTKHLKLTNGRFIALEMLCLIKTNKQA